MMGREFILLYDNSLWRRIDDIEESIRGILSDVGAAFVRCTTRGDVVHLVRQPLAEAKT